MGTICRENDGWSFSGSYVSNHSTRNGIRYNIIGGYNIFKELHKESQVKTKSNTRLCDLKNKYREPLEMIEEKSGKKYTVLDIPQFIKNFCSRHKTDKDVDDNVKKVSVSLAKVVDDGYVTKNDIESAIKVLKCVDEKMYTTTLISILAPLNNFYEEKLAYCET
jgi:hypothetical protein